MRKNKIFLPMMAISLLFGLGLGACNKPADNPSKPSSSQAPAKEKIAVTDEAGKNAAEVEIDGTLQLKASVEGVTWASSNQNVATVNEAGKVTAVGIGSANITASKDGYDKGTFRLTVKRGAPLATLKFEEADHYAADGWWGSADEGWSPIYAREDGNASDKQCIAHLDNGDKETLTFSSSAAIKAELVIMMASSNGVEDMGSVMNVKLNNNAVAVSGKSLASGSSSEFIEFSLGQLDLVAGDNVLALEFLASAPYIDDLMFYSKQQATITAKPAAAKQQIQAAATAVDVNIGGDPVQIVLTAPASLEGVSYISSKPEVATVDETGKISGLKFGSATITIMKEGWYSARITATVDKAKVEGEIRVEAETPEELPDSFHMYTDKTSGIQNGHYGGAYITGYDVHEACTLSYKFTSPKAQTMTLIIAGASHYQMAEDFVFGVDCTLKLNGATITPKEGAKIESNQVMGAPTVEVEIGDVNVVKDENTFVIEFAERAPALDAFRFIPKA